MMATPAAANVLDLTGDRRVEIVLWDTGRVWMYMQDRPFKGDKIYDNESNYRTNVSLPNREAPKRK